MFRTVRAATLAALAASTLAWTDGSAKVAFPPLCGVPDVVVGCPSGAAFPSCTAASGDPIQRVDGFRVVLRDVSNVPLPGEEVVLDFSATPVHLLGDDRPGTTVDCAAHTIRRVTDLEGVVVFAPRFCGGTEEARVRVIANGVWVREIPARSTDLDGDGVTGPVDFLRVTRNYLGHEIDGTTDFTPCSGEPGITSLEDFVLFAGDYLRGAAGTPCP